MYMKKNKRISLIKYWTTRYLITLFIGLFIIAIISIYWIKQTKIEFNIERAQHLAGLIAERVPIYEDEIDIQLSFQKILARTIRENRLKSRPHVYIVNQKRKTLFQEPRDIPELPDDILTEVINGNQNDKKYKANPSQNQVDYLYFVKSTVTDPNTEEVLGYVIIGLSENEIVYWDQELRLVIVMIIGLALLGWAVIYFLSRRISQPIQNVAEAAKQIQQGNYNIQLFDKIEEKEVHDLVNSFKEMSHRLKQLEILRATLLAGVTHELKTPVASISGLIQAVRDEVVIGEEATEFMDISLSELNRLQLMINDLLDFNAFTAGSIKMKKEKIDLSAMIVEAATQWHVSQPSPTYTLDIQNASEPLYSDVDPLRIQQIIVNLLNNAKEALPEGTGHIAVNIRRDQQDTVLDIRDTGIGIPPEEQSFIFERFYRGNHKKHRIRGLGLGLSFSQLIAHAHHGELYLKESSKNGTIFTLTLPLSNDNRSK
ncbi:HAMP domain-containing histidine kinase [Hazenella sp. IB182357]|uniref:histidine kinase n=2 Tax=Polycladospora coralii TaxID=2771432 RepID=A0A926N6M8_9BACL|nr:HAMP domain-containing histidine kinase [Polycladospora coralii]